MDVVEIDARLMALEQQRNQANNQIVVLAGQLALRDKELADQSKELADLKKKLEELDKPA